MLVTLANPVTLTAVSIDSPSPGTRVEIRSAPSGSASLDQTQVIGTADLGQGVTQIPVHADQPARYVLVWITRLGTAGAGYQSTIGHLAFTATH